MDELIIIRPFSFSKMVCVKMEAIHTKNELGIHDDHVANNHVHFKENA